MKEKRHEIKKIKEKKKKKQNFV